MHVINYICKGWTRGDNTRFLVPNPGGNLPYGVARLSRRHRCWAEDFVVQEIDLGEGLLTYFFACRRATVLFQALINGSTIQEAVMTGYVPEVARSSGAQWLYGGDLLFCAYNDGISGALDCFIYVPFGSFRVHGSTVTTCVDLVPFRCTSTSQFRRRRYQTWRSWSVRDISVQDSCS